MIEIAPKSYQRLRAVLRQPWSGIRRSVWLWLAELWDIPKHRLQAIPNRAHLKRKGIVALPPASLRQRVSGENSADMFLNKGRKCSEGLSAALRSQGREISSFQSILDFGCGCGRTFIWWDLALSTAFYGTDIDGEAIRWCQENYRWGTFSVNRPLPPLPYADDTFDLIYAVSIFTHLNEEFQFRWLEELRRVTRPAGVVLLTLHGEHVWRQLNAKLIAQVKRDGILFVVDDYWKEAFPDWYQSTFHLKEYVIENFAKYFTIVDYILRGVNGHQDILVLKKEV
ncbi:MAG: methyltransferase domain-containing protein [Deltaproteobacteria bacterium]|nr:methyltransferase domain-containing protein [Deltaproteobacteria bacterium]